jgi:hypothetical protein
MHREYFGDRNGLPVRREEHEARSACKEERAGTLQLALRSELSGPDLRRTLLPQALFLIPLY